jgi:hypothetical protein
MSIALIKAVNESLGGEVDYLPYNINDTVITIGLPPVPVNGLQYIAARYTAVQSRYIPSLTGGGVYVSNLNGRGVIEIALMSESATVGAIQAYSLTGVPIPIYATDRATGGTSFCAAPETKVITTPEWKREAFPGLTIFTFEAKRLLISHGVRKSDS